MFSSPKLRFFSSFSKFLFMNCTNLIFLSYLCICKAALMVELVDTRDLKSLGHTGRTGSSPVRGTKKETTNNQSVVSRFFILKHQCVTRAHARAFPRNFKTASTLHNLHNFHILSAIDVWRLLSSLHVFATFCPFFCYFSYKAYPFPCHQMLFSPCFISCFSMLQFPFSHAGILYATPDAFVRHARGVYTSRPRRLYATAVA